MFVKHIATYDRHVCFSSQWLPAALPIVRLLVLCTVDMRMPQHTEACFCDTGNASTCAAWNGYMYAPAYIIFLLAYR